MARKSKQLKLNILSQGESGHNATKAHLDCKNRSHLDT